MVKVGIETKSLKTGHAVRGIGIYTKNLLEALKKLKRGNLVVEEIDSEEQLAKGRYDIIHYPYFDLFFNTLPLKKPVSVVVTIHDVIPLVFARHYPPGFKGRIRFQLQKYSLQTVKAVVTDSISSKTDIVKYLGYPQEKIHVIYLAPSKEMRKLEKNGWREEIKNRYRLPEKFVLYVGDVNWNKNILGLVKACKKIKTPVIIVGKQAAEENFDKEHAENQARLQLLKEYGKDPDVLRTGLVSEQDLVKIYNLASVYCQPSFYEGFGLPVLEAMSCGCPVVASNQSSLPEICKDAAVLVDPHDADKLGKALKSVLQDSKLRKSLIERGKKQVVNFSWMKTARETIKIYEKVVSEK